LRPLCSTQIEYGKPSLSQGYFCGTARKHFKVYKHHRGFWGALRNLASGEYKLVRAVDGISFEIQRGELVCV